MRPLHKQVKLLALLLLSLGHTLDGSLGLSDMLREFLQAFHQASTFLLYGIDMPLIHDLKPLKLMRSMLITEHRTVTAYCPLASVTVIIHRGVIVNMAHLLRLRLLSLQCIDGGCHLFHESAIHQLVDS